jgi:hypothetical protein
VSKGKSAPVEFELLERAGRAVSQLWYDDQFCTIMVLKTAQVSRWSRSMVATRRRFVMHIWKFLDTGPRGLVSSDDILRFDGFKGCTGAPARRGRLGSVLMFALRVRLGSEKIDASYSANCSVVLAIGFLPCLSRCHARIDLTISSAFTLLLVQIEVLTRLHPPCPLQIACMYFEMRTSSSHRTASL